MRFQFPEPGVGTATAITKPTVNALTSNNTRPTITGTWGGSNSGTDTLTVTVNGVTYTTSGGNLSTSGKNWTLTIPTGNALTASGTAYDVTATVTRSGTSVSDPTSGELLFVSGPAVTITGLAGTSDTTPVINGTSTESFVVVRIDPNNDGNTSDAVTYSVSVSGGNWSLNTQTATPMSGTFPASGLTGTFDVLVTATDSSGSQVSANSDLTVTVPSVSITTPISGGYFNDAEDNSASITGTAANAGAQTVTVRVTDTAGNFVEKTGVAVSGGNWTASAMNLSGLREGTLTVLATLGSATDTKTVNHDTIAHVTVLSAFVTGARPTVSGTASTDISSVNVSIGIYLKSGNNIVLNTTVTYNSITVSSVNGKLAASIHRSGHGATVEA